MKIKRDCTDNQIKMSKKGTLLTSNLKIKVKRDSLDDPNDVKKITMQKIREIKNSTDEQNTIKDKRTLLTS